MSDYLLGVVSFVDREVQRQRLRSQLMPDLIQVDDGTYGAMGNHYNTILTLSRMSRTAGCNWIVIVEDDALPVLDFHHQINMALDVAPSAVVSLYNGSGYPAQSQRQFEDATEWEECWLLHSRMRHAVGYALRSEVFELGLLEQMAKLAKEGWAPDDAISAWCLRRGMDVAYTNPSLVDHEDHQSVIRGRTHLGLPVGPRVRPRHAHRVGQRLTWNASHARV